MTVRQRQDKIALLKPVGGRFDNCPQTFVDGLTHLKRIRISALKIDKRYKQRLRRVPICRFD